MAQVLCKDEWPDEAQMPAGFGLDDNIPPAWDCSADALAAWGADAVEGDLYK